MPEKNIFRIDPYLIDLETKLVSSRTDERGSWYSFKETIFYPQGGGQSSDKGWINSIDVNDVQSLDGEVWHLLDTPITDNASMRLDWKHRYSNMQQHTGQHILSSCLKKDHDLDTVSVHLGSDITMIELATLSVENEILEKIEISANQMIRENLPVESILINRNELDKYPIRRKVKTEDEKVRLVQIGDIDCVGCGGTHVRSTGEVGLIKITGVEKIRGHTRIKIKIGTTAYQYFGQLHQTLQMVSTHLTTSIEDLSDRIDSLLVEKRELISEKKKISELWLSEMAKNLKAERSAGCFTLRDLSKDHLKILSEHYLEKNQIPCLFISEESGRIHFYIRIPQRLNKNVQDFVQRFRSRFALKGGGGKDFAVGQIESEDSNSFSPDFFFLSFNEFVDERSGK